MSGNIPSGSNPFEFFMRSMLGGQVGSLFPEGSDFRWDMVVSMANLAVVGLDNSILQVNVEPTTRIKVESLFDIVDMHLDSLEMMPALPKADRRISLFQRTTWLQESLNRWKPLLNELLNALTPPGGNSEEFNPFGTDPAEQSADSPMERMMAMMQKIAAPALVASQIGWAVGELSKSALGQLDLPIPRETKGGIELIPENIESFAEANQIEVDHLYIWVMVRELIHLAIINSVAVKDRLDFLIRLHIADSHSALSSAMQNLSQIDPTDSEAMQNFLTNPSALVAGGHSEAQKLSQNDFQALLALIEGMVDYQSRILAEAIFGDFAQIEGATKQNLLDPSNTSLTVASLLGISITAETLERGAAFISGVLERDGGQKLSALWNSPEMLPTPAEIDAPGLWLARIEYIDT